MVAGCENEYSICFFNDSLFSKASKHLDYLSYISCVLVYLKYFASFMKGLELLKKIGIEEYLCLFCSQSDVSFNNKSSQLSRLGSLLESVESQITLHLTSLDTNCPFKIGVAALVASRKGDKTP